MLQVIVENELIDFELDTGSALTCISKNLFTNLFSNRKSLELRPAGTRIRVANGSTVNNVLICEVNIRFRLAKYCKAQLYVIDGPFPSLIGRDWISLFWGPEWISQMIGKPVQGRKDHSDHHATVLRQGTEEVCSQEVQSQVRSCDVSSYSFLFNQPTSHSISAPHLSQPNSKVLCVKSDKVSVQSRLEALKQSCVFQPGIGEVVGFEATLQLK